MTHSESTGCLGPLARVVWMLIGPLALAVLAYNIIKTAGGWLTGADFAYLAVLVAIGLARWVEFRYGKPETAQGEPATPGDLRRYLIGLSVVGILAWACANVMGNYLLAS